MKPNGDYHWLIVLRGEAGERVEFNFRGRLDEALSEADEQECWAEFEVIEFIVTRKERAT